MQSKPSTLVVLGTGGTIAGTADDAHDNLGYRAAQLRIEQLLGGVPLPLSTTLEAEQVAQLDSKDMDHATWLALARRCAHHLAREEVAGIVVTHGTDTLEETAWFLQRVLAPGKPLVLTGAMRPATALQSDGPQNLADALQVAAAGGARGVLTVMAGRVHGPREVRKRHPYRLDAFGSGDGGPAALVEEGAVRVLRPWPEGEALGVEALPGDVARWPKVEIVTSHAAATGALVRALVGAGVDGLVVAGTGNGTVHRDLEAALLQAQARGVRVMRATRCAEGRVLDTPGDAFASAGELTPVKARVELMLQIIAGT